MKLSLNQTPASSKSPSNRPSSADTGLTSELIHQSVAQRAVSGPERVAVVQGSGDMRQLLYSQLDDDANRLARHLMAHGVGRGTKVGLMVERSPEMIVALLAVLKAGGAYVPIDPSYPEERLRFILNDLAGSGRTPLITQEKLLSGLPETAVPFLVDGERGADPAGPFEEPSLTALDLAYVIYTSGSTGVPKGVAVPHGGVANVIREAVRAFEVTPDSRVLQIASASFDASVLEIFLALTSGATLHLVAEDDLVVGSQLADQLRSRHITHIAVPPSLLDTLPRGKYPDLECIVVGGEAVSAESANTWQRGRRVFNAYAPTETTIFTTLQACHGEHTEPPALGFAIAGTEVHLLADGDTSTVGEIAIGGGALAWGYLGRPRRTARSFVPDAFSAAPGARLYLSGDLARRLPEGNLTFVGRADDQVKVRGYRIELGEIAAVLQRHPAVRDATVIVREDVPGSQWIVAYWIAEDGIPEDGIARDGDVVDAAALDAVALEAHCRRSLPEYMVPAAFVGLESFPVTAHGKLDKAALPAPQRQVAGDAPQGDLETRLAEIWAELLGLDALGRHDDLFQLGGHSLLVAQIVARVRERLGLEIKPIDVFTTATVAGLAERVASLREVEAAKLPPLAPEPRDGTIPLTFPQEQVWFLNQYTPDNLAYNFQFTLRLRGPLDVSALQRALQEIVRRHESLRTTFPDRDGTPVQEIHPPYTVHLPIESVADERTAEARVLELVRQPFDLEKLPLLAWTLLRISPEDHFYVHVEHHLVHDGWSLAVYLRELKALYEAYSQGLSSPLDELPVQFADFALWQRRAVAGELLEQQLESRRRLLAEIPPPLDLPLDRPRPQALSTHGAILRVDFPPEIYADLRAFCRRQGTTLYMAMMTVFQTLLYRWTGQSRFLLGSGIANRRLKTSEGLIGMIVNTVVMRADLRDDDPEGPTFRELLHRVRDVTLDAQENQDLPFEKLVEELAPDRDPSRNPLFQVLFSFHDSPVPDLDIGDLRIDLFERHNNSAKTDLNVVVKPRAEQRVGLQTGREEELLTMVWEYSTDLFERRTVERLFAHFVNLLRAGIAAPDERLGRLAILDAEEEQQLLALYDDTATAYPRDALVSELFLACAAARPGDIAIVDGDDELTYDELAQRAAQLAQHLRRLGVGRDPERQRVAVAMDRGTEAVVTYLAILMAGGAYVPLDPSYPAERQALMLDDSQAQVIVGTDELLDALPELPAVVCPERDRHLIADLPAEPPSSTAHPLTPAYVMYTSGSTGRPKGVVIPQRAIVRLVRETSYLAVAPGDRMALVSNTAFDAATYEIWGALLNGARLVVIPRQVTLAPRTFADALERLTIDHMFLTAALFNQMAQDRPDAFRGMKALLVGGDRFEPRWARDILRDQPPARLQNAYGPTESTTYATWFLTTEVGCDATSVPIGYAINNTRLRVTDRRARLVPRGVPGELLIGGDGLALGYLDRPALTAEKFVPLESARRVGERWYRSGDLVRVLPDGAVDCLGRFDHQIKLRGFRIELGEIEAALLRHERVVECVVVVHDDDIGGRRLIAYVAGPATPSASELRRSLEKSLPPYMVPSDWVSLDALPLNANGKVDRKKLPRPVQRGVVEVDFIEPRAGLESQMAEIWCELLQVEKIGRNDDFFELGGHSLLATRVMARLRDALGVDLELRHLFASPTLASFAEAIAEVQGPGDEMVLEPVSRDQDLPLSFAQERLWVLDRLEPGSPVYNMPRAFVLRGDLDRAALAAAFHTLMARHESLRTAFPPRADSAVQVVLPLTSPSPLALVDLSALPTLRRRRELQRLAAEELARPFDLERGPLLRAWLARLEDGEEHALFLTLHHIAADEWSVAILRHELATLYAAALDGTRPDLPELAVQYPDFAHWQRRWLSGIERQRQLDYWQQQLRGAPAFLDLPIDRPRPQTPTSRGAIHRVELDAELAAATRATAQGAGATVFMTMLATFEAFLMRLSGQRDLVVGTPVANRKRPEVEPLIGFFVNMAVLRASSRSATSLVDLIATARDAVLGAEAHQDLPFEQVVEALQPQRDLSYMPYLQTVMAMETTGRHDWTLPGLTLEPLTLTPRTSKFELALSLSENNGFRGWWAYRRELFDASTIQRLSRSFEIFLRGAVGDPYAAVAELPLLSAVDQQQLLQEWNAQPAGEAPDLLHELVSRQARRTPERIALVYGDQALSFKTLVAQGRQLAGHLRALGVGPGSVVGICLQRSLELVTSAYGVLEAGAAYLPLDPTLPAERLAFMIADTGASCAVAQDGQLLPESVAVVPPDAAGESAQAATQPHDLAYVIYTSGSTGQPKGVAIPHRAIASRLAWVAADDFDATTRFLLKASIGFDLSVAEIFATLVTGARLIIVPPGQEKETGRLVELIEAHGITDASFQTALLKILVEDPRFGDLPSLRRVVTGAEAVPPDLIASFHQRFPDVTLENRYGPTETTISVTQWPFPRRHDDRVVPIGRPVASAEIYVLDRAGRQVPSGVSGEILIGGPSLARGYLERRTRSSLCFVPHPFATTPGRRLYRSGDLGRLRGDGVLEFGGRIDKQVKVRGFRIELGEIENALRSHPTVERAVVDDLEVGGDRRLAAWVVLDAALSDPAAELESFLASSLPEYMVPSAITVVDELPINASGKVDRAALPAPQWHRAAAHGVGPRTLLEESLAEIWRDVLGRPVGIHQSFFDLGGHSLLATRMLSRIRQTLGVELPLRQLFQTPTLATLAEVISELSRHRTHDAAPPLVALRHDDPPPLSFAQQRLWFIDRFAPGNKAYNMPIVLDLRGPLDDLALRRSLNSIVQRHDVLRTTFHMAADGELFQKIAPPAPVELETLDLHELGAEAAPQAAVSWLKSAASRSFDLTHGPLLRLALLRLAPEHHQLFLNMHHIISDGWSIEVLVRELATCYRALLRDDAPPRLPELAVQYADFARWQRQTLRPEVVAPELAYWRQRLGDSPKVLELATDRPRPPIRTFTGASRRRNLGSELSARLGELSRQQAATLFMTLTASFQVLLARHTGRSSINVGTPLAGRDRIEVEGLIGFFVNTLVLHLDLSGNPTFGEVLGRARDMVLEAHQHQDLPFEKLVEEVHGERRLNHPPLFQVAFTLRAQPATAIELPDLEVSLEPVDNGTTKLDLSLGVEERNGDLHAALSYNTDLFDASTVARMLRHYEHLLELVVADPAARLSELSPLRRSERGQLLREWNDTALSVEPTTLVHEQVVQRAVDAPRRAAVVGPTRWTYGELTARAQGLAQQLHQLGVGPDIVVAVYTGRTPEMVLGSLATLIAGGTYLPLDPAHPPDRLAFMLEDSGAAVVLTRATLLPTLPRTVSTICLDDEAPAFESATLPVPHGDNLAYLIYTSGSTGVPLGVGVSHRALHNLLATYAALTPDDRVSQVAGPAFDVAAYEIWSTLSAGASLHLPDEAKRSSPIELWRWLADEEITVSYWPTSLVDALMSEDELGQGGLPPVPSLRVLQTAGDQLHKADFGQLPVPLINLYGPTEATVFATEEPVPAVDLAQDPAIGRPLANYQTHVADREMRLVVAGIPGELLIGGGLARGYLGRAASTAERFVPDPFTHQEGARLYRSGDRVRRLADGRLDFLGRFDHQIQIRGFRVELGEIEASLELHPDLRQAVVVARQLSGGVTLRAFVRVADGRAPTSDELRAWLDERLPGPMIPADFVALDTLPLNANGKVDRRALAALASAAAPASGIELGSERRKPRTLLEETLADMWRDLLGTPVGVHQSFFEVGGHSLLATRLLARIRQVTGLELPLMQVFQTPTIAGLAERIELGLRVGEKSLAPTLVAAPRGGRVPLSFAQQRLWLLEQLTPGNTAYNMPLALRLSGDLDVAALHSGLTAIVHRHEVLRTTFDMAEDGEPYQVIAEPSMVALPLIDLGALPSAEAQRWLDALAGRAFDLVDGPLLRCALLRLDAQEHVLFVNLHHIVSDGWSLDVMLRELSGLYGVFTGDAAAAPLTDLPVQYADFAIWQRQWLRHEVLAAEIDYWRHQLADTQEPLELPFDRPRPAVQTFNGASYASHLGDDVGQRLGELSRQQAVTLFMTLTASFQILLARYCDRPSVHVGTPLAGRDRVEIEDLIGFFVNTLVLRLDLAGDPTVAQALGRARDMVLEAHQHQDVPFDKLVEELQADRQLSHSPLFQISFNLLAEPLADVHLPGLEIAPHPIGNETAKVDLTVTVHETADGLSTLLIYNTDLFDRSTIVRLSRHFQQLLGAVASHPDEAISRLPLLTASERNQLLQEWNDTPRGRRGSLWVHQLVDLRAAEGPQRLAVAGGDQRFTYGELQTRSRQLAGHLRGLGVGPDVVVAVYTERCPEMVLGNLAVLASGGAYLPLDPAYPKDRLAFMLADSGVDVVLTQKKLVATLPPHVEVICLDEELDLDVDPGELPVPDGDNLAYMIYTSGSTGRPKGVMISHRNLRSFVAWTHRDYRLHPLDRGTQVATPAFDVSVLELWPMLTAGASVHFPDEAVRLSADALWRFMADEEITVATFPTPLLESLLDAEVPGDLALRLMTVGGDRLHRRDFGNLPCPLVNHYGPTETTVCVTGGEVAPRDSGIDPPIGRAFDHARVQVTDARLRLLPSGVAGELVIGDVCVARGYLDRPARTAEKFIPNPFAPTAGQRLYRTGDRVRQRTDGNLVFLGRVDHQVKVRGYRIELGEIEAALARHPAVHQAAVVTRRAAGSTTLSAFLRPSGELPSSDGLRSWLLRSLPDYMVPVDFTPLESFPLTPNGKLDRAALAERVEVPGVLEAARVASRDTLEMQLVQIWEDILQTRPISVTDRFFQLGGHSLLAIRLMARIRVQLGRELPLDTLFQNDTIEALAAVLRQQSQPNAFASLVPLASDPERQEDPFFLVHPAGGHVFCYLDLVQRLPDSRCYFGFAAPGLDDGELGPTELSQIAALYVDELLRIQPEGPYHLGGWSLGGALAFEMARQLEGMQHEIATLALIDPSTILSEDQRRGVDEARLTRSFARDLGRVLGKELALPPDAEGDLLGAVLSEAKTARILPPDTDLDQLRRHFAVFRNGVEALTRYRPQPCSCPVTLFLPEQGMGRDLDAVAAHWRGLAPAGLKLHRVPGHHYTMLRDSGLEALIHHLTNLLQSPQPQEPTS